MQDAVDLTQLKDHLTGLAQPHGFSGRRAAFRKLSAT